MQSNLFKLLILMGLLSCQSDRDGASSGGGRTKKGPMQPFDKSCGPLLERARYIGGDSREFFLTDLQDSYWFVPKEAFSCKGSEHNSSYYFAGELIEDCDKKTCNAGEVSERIQQFLSAFQAKVSKRLTIVIGTRCQKHERYINAKEHYQDGRRVVIRLKGVSREELKKMMALQAQEFGLKVYEKGFALDDPDLWGESHTVLIEDGTSLH
jgi:hypothetical protein